MHVSLSLDGRPHLSSVNNRLSGLMGSMSPMTADIVDFYLNSTGAKLAETNDIQLRYKLDIDYFKLGNFQPEKYY